ncbi:MAG: ribonucleoside triphosphate reductase, partial [Treponema sp.]|nr:ribonucleoside triphosphate reductase [Treponema sp.]
MIKNVVKRSGVVEEYDQTKIANAAVKAFIAVNPGEREDIRARKTEDLTRRVEEMIEEMMAGRHPNSIPAIEEIQDLVENALIEARETATAKAYILYRAKHEAMRDVGKLMLDIDS